jgi:hypothetical protein
MRLNEIVVLKGLNLKLTAVTVYLTPFKIKQKREGTQNTHLYVTNSFGENS